MTTEDEERTIVDARDGEIVAVGRGRDEEEDEEGLWIEGVETRGRGEVDGDEDDERGRVEN